MEYLLRKNLIARIRKIHASLISLDSLAPSLRTNMLFGQLVHIIRTTSPLRAESMLEDPSIKDIRNDLLSLCSKGESLLEEHWAKHIIASSDSEAELKSFPYYSNYEAMAALEAEGLRACGTHKKHKMLFIGSGPLPLTAIILAKHHGITIDCLDSDLAACTLSSELIAKLGLEDTVRIRHGDILDIDAPHQYNTLFLAALVGKDEKEKNDIISHLKGHIKPGTHLILRSVSDLGELLYPEITATHLEGLKVLRRTSSPQEIINHIIITQKI